MHIRHQNVAFRARQAAPTRRKVFNESALGHNHVGTFSEHGAATFYARLVAFKVGALKADGVGALEGAGGEDGAPGEVGYVVDETGVDYFEKTLGGGGEGKDR